MQLKELVRIFVKGGIISPADFLKILLTADKLGATHIHFGSRQDILFPVAEDNKESLDDLFDHISAEYEINNFYYQNISSSYAAQDILPGKKWLASHIYHYVLNSFDYRPKLRINVVDPSQSLVPLFTGQVNFIASNQENYWFVYLRFQSIDNTPWQMPLLVYTDDLVKIAQALEEDNIRDQSSYQQIYMALMDHLNINTQPVTENLLLPETHFPYYEGINRLPDGKYWLGLYWRNNQYRISTLKGIMERCIETEVGKVSLTPWKSFIIKGIIEKDLIGWEKLMGKFGMNLRHSALELNWHLPALDEEALELKFYLVRELDKLDISTYGLTFTVKTTSDITPFTSVLLEKNADSKNTDSYNILYSRDFNSNVTDYQIYAAGVPRSVLPSLIVELSVMYFENIEDNMPVSHKVQTIRDNIDKEMFQCTQCQTVYDAALGDSEAGIGPQTPFENLPDDYACSTCGSAKHSFVRMR